jgi:hypothetical protein
MRGPFSEFNFGLYRSIVTPTLQETESNMQIYEVERLQYVRTFIIPMNFCCLIVRISLTLICIRCRCKFIAVWLINIAGKTAYIHQLMPTKLINSSCIET